MKGNIPFSPSKFPFFYGWIILAAGAVGVVMSIPGQTMGVSVFTDRLIDSLKISRLNLSLAYMIGTLSSSLLLSRLESSMIDSAPELQRLQLQFLWALFFFI